MRSTGPAVSRAHRDDRSAAIGPLEDLYPLDHADDALEPWDADEEDWQSLEGD